MAAGSMSSNAASPCIQSAGSSRFFHCSHSPNSLLLQNKKTLAKLPEACLRTSRVVGLGLGLYHKNTLTARSNVLMRKTSLAKTLVNVFSEHTVTTEEEGTESNAGTAAIGVDEESLVEVKDNVGRANESTNGSNLPESTLFSLDTSGSPHEVYNEGSAHEDRVVAVVQEENGAAGPESSSSLYLESNGAACLESNGALSHKDRITAHGENIAPYLESNGSTHARSSGAMSIGGNGAADNENNEASYSERNGAILEERSSIANATDIPESGFKDETTEGARVVCNSALPLENISSPVKSEEGSLDAQFQSDRQPDTNLQPYSLSLSTDEDRERSAKDKVESIGQEDPWFKQAGQSKTPVSITPGGRWNQFKTYSTIQRTCEIWFFVATFLFKAWLINQKFAYKGGITEEKKKEKRGVLAKWLKEGLLRLGPTFIKIGQQFSTRVDILPQEYVDQLAELQDQVPPFESEIALKIVEEELGAPVGEIFEQFDPDPIAAASLGQVHRAVFKNEEVVVKVQRPGLKELFDIDLKNLRVIAENLQKLDPKSDGAKRDWVAIYDECASVLYQEIDYCKEGANAERFANNFKDLEYVRVPKVYWECTTPQVLTMEYVPGIKINRIAALDQLGVDRKKLAQYAVESYLEQILRHGFFHADPHPGNIAVDDENGGRLIFYDFGMMGSVSSNIREGLLETFYGVYEKDPDKVLQAMVQMGVLVPTGDMTAVRRTAQFFLNSFEERLAAQRAEREATKVELGFKKRLTKEERIEKKKMRLAAIGEDLLSISVDQPFRFPATFTFVVRAFSVLDGIGKGLDPRFDISEIAKPYALEILKFREVGYDVLIRDFKKRWKRQAQAFSNLFRQADRVEKLAEVIQRLEQGDLKLRVRTLESERAFKRMATMQQTTAQAVLAGVLLNLATILQLHAVRAPALAAFVGSAVIGVKVLIGLLKVKKLDKQEKLITGTA